jgi:hypothetical protein
MKRRGFLGVLFGAPAAAAAAVAVSKLPEVPKVAPVESEPVLDADTSWLASDYDNCFTVCARPIDLRDWQNTLMSARKKLPL